MIHVIRIIFLLMVSAVSVAYLVSSGINAYASFFTMIGGVVLSFAIITCDLLFRRKNLSTISGLFFGLLVGILVSLGLGWLIDEVLKVYVASDVRKLNQPLIQGGKLLCAVMVTYLTVSFILQTKDDFRFIIPYVEFTRATRAPPPHPGYLRHHRRPHRRHGRDRHLRFAACSCRASSSRVQAIADSGDKLKRSRGRRGLEFLQRLQAHPKLDLGSGTAPSRRS